MATDIDLGQVVMLKPGANNPATKPALTDELIAASIARPVKFMHCSVPLPASLASGISLLPTALVRKIWY